jgi:hypothetical protein
MNERLKSLDAETEIAEFIWIACSMHSIVLYPSTRSLDQRLVQASG